MSKILIVEDDQNLGLSLKKFFEDEGHTTTLATSIAEAENKLDNLFEIIILDWMLPDGQGIDFLKKIRPQIQIPVIMLTARTELIDKIVGLENGANDYMTKPFEPRELMARVRVQLRDKNANQTTSEIISINELEINISKREVIYNSKIIDLTKMEFDFLKLLSTFPGKSFSREEILNKVWGFENFPTTRTVDTHVLQLRQKLSENLIETVWGVGYRLKESLPD